MVNHVFDIRVRVFDRISGNGKLELSLQEANAKGAGIFRVLRGGGNARRAANFSSLLQDETGKTSIRYFKETQSSRLPPTEVKVKRIAWSF